MRRTHIIRNGFYNGISFFPRILQEVYPLFHRLKASAVDYNRCFVMVDEPLYGNEDKNMKWSRNWRSLKLKTKIALMQFFYVIFRNTLKFFLYTNYKIYICRNYILQSSSNLYFKNMIWILIRLNSNFFSWIIIVEFEYLLRAFSDFLWIKLNLICKYDVKTNKNATHLSMLKSQTM